LIAQREFVRNVPLDAGSALLRGRRHRATASNAC
jgi:hypothetical protein